MRNTGFLLALIFLFSACQREEKISAYKNTIRNDLAGVWQIQHIHSEGFTTDSVKGITLTQFDTTYQGINSYYTIHIPTVDDQWNTDTKGYGVIQNEYFDFLLEAECNNKKLSKVQFDLIFCKTCNLHSELFINYIMGMWNVTDYQVRDHLKLYKYFYVNGVKRESFLDLKYALPY